MQTVHEARWAFDAACEANNAAKIVGCRCVVRGKGAEEPESGWVLQTA